MNPTSSHSSLESRANPSGVFAQCLQQATVLSRAMMGELLLKADTLMRASQSAETELPARMAMGEAADALARHRDLLTEQFPGVLDKAMAQALRGGPDASIKLAAAAPLRFDQLELMDDAQMQGRIDAARMQQSATQGCERELGELDALVCAARGFPSVQLDRNPFRPQIVGAALMEVLSMAPSTPQQRAVWTQSVGASLGEQLRRLYQQLSDFLRNQQVQSATYAMAGSASGSGGSGGSRGSGGGAVSMGPAAGPGHSGPSAGHRSGRVDSSRLTVNQLRHVLGSDYFQQSAQAYEVEQDVQALEQLVQQLSSENYREAAADKTDAMGAESELHTSRANALSVYEVPAEESAVAGHKAVAQDVVRMMVDNLCEDQRLLEVVRDWVGSLEPALLALSVVDVGFLSDKRHPARLLLDEVTARSLGFADEAAEGFNPFFDPVLVACAQLQPHAMPNAQPFELVWQTISTAWSEQKSVAQTQSEHAMQALLQAEQRNLLADKIALELTRRDDARLAPIFVKQFVAGPWAQVLAHTRLNPAQLQAAQDYLEVVAELFWSVVPEQASRNKHRLVRMIPQLLGSIRKGLALIGSPAHEADAFFLQLMAVHEAGLKAGLPSSGAAQPKLAQNKPVVSADARTQAAISAPPAIDQAAMKTGAPESSLRADDAVWLAPQEERDSGFLDDRDAPQSTLPTQDSGDLPAATDAQPPKQEEINDLLIIEPPTMGSWVEYLSNDRWVRAQLTWASPHGTLFMFTGAAGNPTSMTRRALDKMQAKQTLRIITQDSVLVGALNAVAQTAMRNTIKPTAV
jgi:hypothetical protein